MKPTAEQITEEIKKLKEMKPRVRRTSAFGDNHHDSIDAQIEVLEGNLREGVIYDRGVSEEEEDDSKWKQNVLDCALDARRWMDGDEKASPSQGWTALLIS